MNLEGLPGALVLPGPTTALQDLGLLGTLRLGLTVAQDWVLFLAF